MTSRALRLAGLAAALALLVVGVRAVGGAGALRDLLGGAGVWAPVVLLAAWVVGTPLLVPGTALCAVAGLVLGPLGVAVSLAGSPLGALAAFLLARRLGPRDRLSATRAAPLVARVERAGPWGVALVRMTPALPVGAFNYACGLTRVEARHFVLGSLLGAAPRIVLYGSLGGALASLPLVS